MAKEERVTALQFYEQWRKEHADDVRGDWPIRMLQDAMDSRSATPPTPTCAMCGGNMTKEELGWYCNSCQPRRYAPEARDSRSVLPTDESKINQEIPGPPKQGRTMQSRNDYQSCPKCGTRWFANETLPCPRCENGSVGAMQDAATQCPTCGSKDRTVKLCAAHKWVPVKHQPSFGDGDTCMNCLDPWHEARAAGSLSDPWVALREWLKAMADAEYGSYISQMEHPAAQGWEAKCKAGKFGDKELTAHTMAGTYLGQHQALMRVLRHISPAPPSVTSQEKEGRVIGYGPDGEPAYGASAQPKQEEK